ncbi:MAG: Xaa-Pro peptidase family protein [Actinomycetota bacterium]|nr:Xaa-Pro peptidase family protein [Actinomycetota bacterium]
MTPRQERALVIAREAGADGVLAAEPATVTWLTGLEADVESGPSPFALAPLAVLPRDGPPILVVSADEEDAARELGCEVVSYPGFTTQPLDPVGNARRALMEATEGRTLVTEPRALSAALAENLSLVDAQEALARARAVKDADELGLLRTALELCDVGQRAAREHVAEGLTEIELWGEVRAAVEQAAGRRTPLLADLVSGERTGETGGAPGERVLRKDDVVLCDLVPRLAGYWGDSCTTLAVGTAPESARAGHRRVREALARGLDAVEPGVRASDLDALVREGLDYPHHTGHGIGTSWHEEPRIVPGGATVLEAGMVVALEPGVYSGAEGVRLEQVAVVTHDGCEVLSGFSLDL